MTVYRLFTPAGLVLATLLAGAGPATAQRQEPPLDVPTWVGDAADLGVNALLGGLTAGVAQKARGGSFQDGFTRGMAGGAVVYWGKRLAVQNFAASGLVGREVAAVGASVVRNAADGRPSLQRVMLPVGPLHLYLEGNGSPRLRARLDLATLAAAAYGVAEPELEWDAASSWSSGAPVFRVRNQLLRGEGGREIGAAGITRAGTIYLSQLPGLNYPEDLRHERVHVIQNDQFFLTWTDPVEDALLQRLPGGRWVSRFVDVNLSPLVTSGLAEVFKNYDRRPWELEAEFLARR